MAVNLKKETKTDVKAVTVDMSFAKMTKNTVQFKDIKDSDFAADVIGTLYVPKATLGQLGYAEGKKIRVSLEVID